MSLGDLKYKHIIFCQLCFSTKSTEKDVADRLAKQTNKSKTKQPTAKQNHIVVDKQAAKAEWNGKRDEQMTTKNWMHKQDCVSLM